MAKQCNTMRLVNKTIVFSISTKRNETKTYRKKPTTLIYSHQNRTIHNTNHTIRIGRKTLQINLLNRISPEMVLFFFANRAVLHDSVNSERAGI